jgi:phospholipid transport system substrate-binding protein
MKAIKKIFAAFGFIAGMLSFAPFAAAQGQEAPDALVKRISQEVLEEARADKEIQNGNHQRVLSLVEERILPHINFERMTALAAGRFWREATPEQKKQLIDEFRSLLVYTYSGAIAQINDQKLEFKPLRAGANDTEVVVRSQVVQPRGGDPIQLSYRMEKTPAGWKIYDVNVLGAWLVETYKGNFAAEISKGGIDGLIKTLQERNKRLAAGLSKRSKAS